MQTVGTLMVLLAMVIGVVGGSLRIPMDAKYDWIGPAVACLAMGLGLVGIVVSIVGRCRNGGPV